MNGAAALSAFHATQILDALVVDEQTDLAWVALLIAAENGRPLVMTEQLAQIDALATEAANYIKPSESAENIAQSLCFFMKEVKGFKGNHDNYYNPDNSFLDLVLQTGEGIPITLALLYICVAKRLGIQNIVGVGFPGHFLVKIQGEQDVLIDPYFHKIIQESECEERIRHLYGKYARMHRSYLLPVSAGELLARMVRNLVDIYKNKHLYDKALLACSRAIKFAPDYPEDYYLRATLYELLECPAAAIQEYAHFIHLAPQDDRISDIKQRITVLREQSQKKNVLH